MWKAEIHLHRETTMYIWLTEEEATRLLAEYADEDRPDLGDFAGEDQERNWKTDRLKRTKTSRILFDWDEVRAIQIIEDKY